MYGSRRMKDWQEVLKLYQKENLNLAECASILGRNVVYEIPALKRQTTKFEQSQAECLKREESYRKLIHEYREKFLHSCAELGIRFEDYNAKTNEGKVPTVDSIGLNIVNQMKEKLPVIFERLTTKSKGLREAVLFYRKFLKTTINLNEQQLEDTLVMLYTVIGK